MGTTKTIKRSLQDIQCDAQEPYAYTDTIQMRESGIDYLTLEEFCGRFDLTEAKAKWEVRRCELQDCGYSRYVLQYQSENGKLTHRITPDISGVYLIPESEADRYQTIIVSEHSKPEPNAIRNPADSSRKRSGKLTDEQKAERIEFVKEYIKTHRVTETDEKIAYDLHKEDYDNTEIGVGFGWTYTPGHNDLAMKITRLRKKHEKLLGT